jgi:two-component system, response regulator YesN
VTSVLLVEDDVEMLSALGHMIPWESEGFQIVGQARDGGRGLELIRERNPDIVVSDISMPVMDGLSMIRRAREIGADFEAIVLTCHEDFEYARESISVAVSDYLVKITLTKEELLGSVRKAARIRLRDRRTDTSLLMLEGVYRSYLQHEIPEAEFKEKIEAAGFLFEAGEFRVLQIWIDNLELSRFEPKSSGPHSFRRIFLQRLKNLDPARVESLPITSSDEEQIILVRIPDRPGSGADSLEKLIAEASAETGEIVSAVLSRKLRELVNLRKVIKELSERRCDLYFSRHSGLVQAERNPRMFEYQPLKVEEEKYALDAALALLNYDAAFGAASSISSKLSGTDYAPADCIRFFESLQMRIEGEANRRNLPLSSLPRRSDRLFAAIRLLKESLKLFFAAAEKAGIVSNRSGINRVLRYIREHPERELSASEMAEMAAMSAGHFSRIFKAETGISYSRFLTRLRIERANTLLLETDLPIETIAAEVGFENTSYFYRVYKRETGRTPGDRRR